MPEADGEDRSFCPKSRELNSTTSMPPHTAVERESLTNLDIDLDGSWSFDQIFSAAHPTSPVFVSSSDQPFSPIWTFSEDKYSGNSLLPLAGTQSLSDCHAILSCIPDSMRESLTQPGNRRISSSFLGFAPYDDVDGSCAIKERMARALRYFKEFSDHHFLVQVWVPVKKGDHFVLTTSGQPFVLDPNSSGLFEYRTVSLMYVFCIDGEGDGELGLPGRVFRQKLPEWTPDVQFYSIKEYQRLNHAQQYNVHGTIALPVFEPSGECCVGVLELIMTSQKINYATEVDKVCKALEAVDLKSSVVLQFPDTQICNKGRQNALAEILEILTAVCETHMLPLAQTWVPCRHRSILAYGGGLRKSCISFDGSCMGQICMSTTDVAYYVVDSQMWGFRVACTEHHLQKGQGVAGRAFASRNSCFCENITKYSKNEYPLVHYARMFGLTGSFAICLQSAHTGHDEYILEFFLPPNIKEDREQQSLLDSLLGTMRKHVHSLKIASGKELEEEGKHIEVIRGCFGEKLNLEVEIVPKSHGANDLPNGGEVQNSVASEALKEMSKKSERKRGKAEKTISLGVLQQYFTGSLKDAAKSLGVCPTTMKRICRQHGISRWPSRKINKVNRSLSKLQRVIESVQGAEGAFTLTSIATSTLPVNVNPVPWPGNLNEPNQHSPQPSEFVTENYQKPNCQKENQIAEIGIMAKDEVINDQNGLLPELDEGSSRSKTGSGSTEDSHCSSESPPKNEQISSPINQNCLKLGNYFDTEVNLTATFSIPDALLITKPQEPFRPMLIEDAGSSHDFRNLCPVSEALADEQVPNSTYLAYKEPLSSPLNRLSQFSTRPEFKTITIKAAYRDDIVRFRLPLDSGIVVLKEEVAKRLKLDVGTFDIKYLDYDHEWVLLACEADLQECVEMWKSSGNSIVRLLVQDVMANLGSSCESSGE